MTKPSTGTFYGAGKLTPSNLITTAQDLIAAGQRGRPRQTNLRRAVSTTYYAMFHCLAACCADMLVGGAGADRSEPAWRQTYRALEHGTARRRCQASINEGFPYGIQKFASEFIDMQQKRQRADYAPEATFTKPTVFQDITAAAEAIELFHQTPARDRRAFAVYVLLTLRN